MKWKTCPNKNSETAIRRGIASLERAFTGRHAGRNLMFLSALTLPWVSFFLISLRPNPRQMWVQRWPTLAFVGLYQIALDRCVEVEGLENLPETGPVILAGNHINKTAMDGMLMGSIILLNGGGLSKFVSVAEPPGRMLRHFVRRMGESEGVILPIHKGMTTETIIHYLQTPEAFGRQRSILGIFPAGEADSDFETQMKRDWHTGAAVAAAATGAPIVPFYVEGLPCHWGPLDMLKAVARSLIGGKAFEFRARLGSPLRIQDFAEPVNYKEIIDRVRQAVFQMANDRRND